MHIKACPTNKAFVFASFYCPGCNGYHRYTIARPNEGNLWAFNGDAVNPTFTPSLLEYWIEKKTDEELDRIYALENTIKATKVKATQERLRGLIKAIEAGAKGRQTTRCHLFVTNGQIIYCGDCPHDLAGKTVDMLPVSQWPSMKQLYT